MKVFISWSGAKSKAIAQALNDWIPLVLQSVKPWFSPVDISSGAPWFAKIQEGLKDAKAGIICLSAENKDSPWILFESGAIARGVGESNLKTFLIDLKIEDVLGPLAQFNHTQCNYDSVFKLITDLNHETVISLDEAKVKTVFDALWPKLEKEIFEAQKISTAEIAPRRNDDMIAEVLDTTRQMNLRFSYIETRIEEIRASQESHSYMPGSIYGASPFTWGTNGPATSSLMDPTGNSGNIFLDAMRGVLPETPKPGLWDSLISGLDAKPLEPDKK